MLFLLLTFIFTSLADEDCQCFPEAEIFDKEYTEFMGEDIHLLEKTSYIITTLFSGEQNLRQGGLLLLYNIDYHEYSCRDEHLCSLLWKMFDEITFDDIAKIDKALREIAKPCLCPNEY